MYLLRRLFSKRCRLRIRPEAAFRECREQAFESEDRMPGEASGLPCYVRRCTSARVVPFMIAKSFTPETGAKGFAINTPAPLTH